MSVPDGSKTLHEFHGLTTKDTNDKNQTRTVTKDSQGQVVSINLTPPARPRAMPTIHSAS